MAYPVHFEAIQDAPFTRLELGLRALAVLALGILGISTAGLYGILYLGLPILAALRIGARGSCKTYAEEDGARILFALSWLAAVTSWVGLAAPRLPKAHPDETVRLRIDGTPSVSAGTAALRILYGLPSAFLFALLSCFGTLVWLWAAITILWNEQVPRSASGFLVGLQRYGYRLLAYQAALVDEYPPFALSEDHSVPRAQTSV